MEKILLKISGESISGKDKIVSNENLNKVISQIKEINKKFNVAIVIGGGNIWRGAKDNQISISRNVSDAIGMVATTINATILNELLINEGIQSKVFSPGECFNLTEKINYNKMREWLSSPNRVAIFSGGTGNPYFTTDTGAALRAAEVGAKWIIMGKNGVDGVYSDDPRTNPNATFYEKLNYDEIFEKNINVMDKTALTICKENNIKIKVFNASKENGYLDAINNKIKLTVIE